jgi:DNA-binding response OmpR family regulator
MRRPDEAKRPLQEVLYQEPSRIIVAEDDDALREALVSELTKDGHVVVPLEDGLELRDYLDIAKRSGSTLRWPDVVVSDVTLPGVGGVEVLQDLFLEGDATPFVFLASPNTLEARTAAEQVGAAYVFDKPISMERLRDTVCFLAGI